MSEQFPLKIKLLHPQAKAPARAHPEDAAFDLYAVEDAVFQPGERKLCGLGIAAEFSPSLVALLRDRSGLGSKGLHSMAGVIDASYRGEWKVVLLNTTKEIFEVKAGDRIIQCLFVPVPQMTVAIVDELSDTARAAGGFGSTGR